MTFLTENFLLPDQFGQRLYHEHAAQMPIIDYHTHLSAELISKNHHFRSITEIWLDGDHYKWRAMRANGINEAFITGSASDVEKFAAWAATVPYTMRNPLYHWTHMELANPFGISQLLSPKIAEYVYAETNAQLKSTWTAQALLTNHKVEVVCTTDDPIDSLQYHTAGVYGSSTKVYPTYRPDKAINFTDIGYLDYLAKLGAVAGIEISSYDDLIAALQLRHNYFNDCGCRLSDHGHDRMPLADLSTNLNVCFKKIINHQNITPAEVDALKADVLYQIGKWNAKANWTMQLHLGALRNTNTRLLAKLGPDCGVDSIGDFSQAYTLAQFLNRLDETDELPKTILYNLNPADNEVLATMIGNFQDGSIPGKIQYGSGWWFLDQKNGMERQIDALSNMGLLSRFVGMLTDSRSFLSYSRHEYFRRILCRMFAADVAGGLLPNDEVWLGKLVQDICYNNAKNYFQFSA